MSDNTQLIQHMENKIMELEDSKKIPQEDIHIITKQIKNAEVDALNLKVTKDIKSATVRVYDNHIKKLRAKIAKLK